jgi:hypothetical protein
MRAAQRMAVLFGTAGAVIVLASFLLVWGFASVRAALTGVDWWAPFLLPLAALACIPIHESLHYLGFRMAGAPGEQIRFGVDSQVGFFCGCTAPLRLRGYLVAIVLPVVVLGVCSWLYAMVTGRLSWAAFSATQVILAGGDLIALRFALRQAGNPWVKDVENGIGFDVLSDIL